MSRPRLAVRFQVDAPEAMLVTATVTMTLGDWRRLKSQLEGGAQHSSFPAWKLIEIIRDLVDRAEQHFDQAWEPEE